MRISRLKFVTRFLLFGYAYGIATRLILNQMPASLSRSDYGSVTQAPWQIAVCTILVPVKFVLMGPLIPFFNWMVHQQDADPPPPMIALIYAVYWVILALILHYVIGKLRHSPAADGSAGRNIST